MRTRKLTELYAIAVDNIHLLDTGICFLFSRLYHTNLINRKEYFRLIEHFMQCKPSKKRKYKSFMVKEIWGTTSLFWWKIGEKEIRKQFLIRLREDTKPWYDKIWWI